MRLVVVVVSRCHASVAINIFCALVYTEKAALRTGAFAHGGSEALDWHRPRRLLNSGLKHGGTWYDGPTASDLVHV